MSKFSIVCCVLFWIGGIVGGTSVAAQTMEEAFIAMPDSLLPLLTRNNRLDMVDFVHNHMEARVTNRLGAESRLDTLTADYLKIELTASAAVTMKLFPWNGDEKVLAMVETVSAPACDSRITFFNKEWKELPLFKHFALVGHPSVDSPQDFRVVDFMNEGAAGLTDRESVWVGLLDELPLRECLLAPDDLTLVVRLGLGVLTREQQKIISSRVHELVLEWKSK